MYWGNLEEKCAEPTGDKKWEKEEKRETISWRSIMRGALGVCSYHSLNILNFFKVCVIHRRGQFHFWVVSTNTDNTCSTER